MHALDRHWMPYRHAAVAGPAICLVPAGLACENQQSGRVHLEPNLQAVAGGHRCVAAWDIAHICGFSTTALAGRGVRLP